MSEHEEKIRILICHTCESLEEVPDYEGPTDRDVLLNFKVAAHRYPDGNEHIGVLARVSKDDWEDKTKKSAIVDKINKAVSGGETGLGTKYYDLKNNFQQDAIVCWKQHKRTDDCQDYRSEKKRLVPDTAAERRDLGLSVADRPNTWLCDFCPVSSMVTTRKRKARGDYDKK